MSPAAWLILAWASFPAPGPAPEAWWSTSWQGFPAAELGDGSRALPVTFHGRSDWRWATWLDATVSGDPLPSPRLILDRQRYGTDTTMDRLALDEAEHLLSALLEGILSQDRWRGEIEARTARLVGEWPADPARSAVRRALADLGAHVLSLALEIRRSEARLRERRLDPCPLARDPQLIFALWPRAWTDSAHRPRLQAPGGREVSGPPLSPEDRNWLFREVLGRAWTGDPIADLELSCGETDGGGGRRR